MRCCRSNLIRLAGMATVFAGCYPKSMTASQTVSRTLSDPVVDRIGDLEIQSELVGGTVVVHTTWGRRCHRDVIEVVEETKGHEFTVVGNTGQESATAVFFAVVFYPVGIADFLVTAAVSIADPVRTSRHYVRGNPVSLACPIPAPNVPLHLTLPSSSVIDGLTDASGSYIFMLPADELHGKLKLRVDKVEAPAGSVVARSRDPFVASGPPAASPPEARPIGTGSAHERMAPPGTPDLQQTLPETIDDRQLLAGINAVRARVVACGPRHGVPGIVSVRMTINPEGRITAFHPQQNVARSIALTGCLGNALAAARFPATMRGIQTVLPFNMDDGVSAVPRTVPPAGPAPSPSPTLAPPLTPPAEPIDPSIKALIEKARAAASAGRCATVKAFSHAINDKAPEYYARVLSLETAVAACLK